AARTQDVSRAKIQASIAAGLVLVNGQPAAKASQQLKAGDCVVCRLQPPPPMQALPEAIPLDIKYEDDHVIVVNKPSGMVVHVAPGHHHGTLVNALLHHCALPALDLDSSLDLDPDLGTGIGTSSSSSCSTSSLSSSSCLRPGIVHRLDKGTSGLLVVAKTEVALTRLQAQFKARTVDRLYDSITVGCPVQPNGRVETNICRDPRDRKRMAAAPYGSGRGRTAGSNYTVMAPLAGGGAALVRWKLDTGRTHQIRVHAKYIGHPLLGDDTYGGTAPAALAAVSRGSSLDSLSSLEVVEQLGRPALHARTLGFTHPVTGARLSFEQPVPEDFLRALRGLGMEAAYG
ncbi:RNA pseudouridine synthase mitochondrial precursor, partial [Volvox carteri f. nagariensis]